MVPHFFRFSTHSSTFLPTMAAERVTSIISPYQRLLNVMPFVPATTYGRATLGAHDVANELFLAYLFCDTDVGVHFLKDLGLLRSSMVCCKCGCQMSLCFDTNRKDGLQWRCRRITSASAFSSSTSIRHGSWFQQSNHNFIEFLFLTSMDYSTPTVLPGAVTT